MRVRVIGVIGSGDPWQSGEPAARAVRIRDRSGGGDLVAGSW